MPVANDSIVNALESLLRREQEEQLARASDSSAILSRLNISVDNLPQKCQQVLRDASAAQLSSQVQHPQLDGGLLCRTGAQLALMDDDYQILLLKQKNKELQAKIDRNALEIDQLRSQLSESRHRLCQQNPNPENIEQHCRQLGQKLASYDDSCQRAQAKFTSLGVPPCALPASLVSLATSLGALSEEASSLHQRAEHAELARQARTNLRLLRK